MIGQLVLAAAALCAPGVEVVTSDTGAYNIAVNGTAWLTGGNASFFSDGKWLSVSDGSLSVAVSDAQGEDKFGAYTGKSLVFTAGAFRVDALAKNYDGFAVFDVVYTSGVSNANGSSINGISATYPSFNLVQPSGAPKLGVMAWKGTFIDNSNHGPNLDVWPAGVATGVDSGTHALFDDDHAVIISAASNFMAHTFASQNNALAAGIIGSVTDIPAGYSISTILSGGAAGVGINNEVQAWGDRLRARYGKTWDTYNNDFTGKYLGYNTDHGAYYYYKPNGSYADSMLAVKKQAEVQNIPYRHALIDSWWYFKGTGGGIANWTARPGVFYKDGGDADLVRLNQETGWPFIAHNRYWSSNTPYSKDNGGDYEFSPIINGSYVVPLEQRFWDDLMSNASKWGLKTYEQDWMYNEFDNTPLLHESATQARTWLMQMGEGASKSNVNIQYCMPNPRHAMQSIEIQSVSQIRASDDYVPGHNNSIANWNLGGSSILAHALALRPFKDNFWTSAYEPGGSGGDTLNPDTMRHSCVATLSAGPVTPADGAMYQNASLIMMSTRADGLLLQPERPCTFTDSYIRATAGQGAGPKGHVWSTFTTLNGQGYDIVFTTELTEAYLLHPAELTTNANRQLTTLAYSYTPLSTTNLRVAEFGENIPIELRATVDENDFQVYYSAPLQNNGWALLGELQKWVPVSAARFTSLTVVGSDLHAACSGSKGEEITVWFAQWPLKTTSVKCTFAGDTVTVSSNGQCL